jgi:hypothetical protein
MQIILEKKNIKYFAATLLLQIGTILAFFFADPRSPLIITLNFVMMILFLTKFRKHLALFVLFAYMALYNYAAIKVFYQDYFVSYYYNFRSEEWINKTFFIHSFFLFALGNTIDRRLLKNKIDLHLQSLKSKYLFWFFVVVGIFMIQFGIRGPNMLMSGAYGGGQEKSSLHEYFILVFFILILVKPPKNILNTIVIALLYFFYCVKTVLHGGRIEALEISVLALMYYWLLPKKENKMLLFVLLSLSMYVSSVIGTIRANPVEFLKGDYISILNPFHKSEYKILTKKIALGNNEGDVIQSSNRMLALMDDGFLSGSTRIKSFVTTLASIVVPTSLLPDYANLAHFHYSYPYISGGGGLISVYFFIWLGYAGPLLIGFLIGYFINKGFKPDANIGFRIYAVILIAMSPRWFAYGPNILFKFCLLSVLLYYISKYVFLSFLMNKKDMNIKTS